MTPAEWMVVLGGALTIGWINWYFLVAGKSTATAALGASGVQEVTITVQGGYEPAEVRVRRGAPVRLVFDRKETSGCSEEVVFPKFGIRRFLPAHQRTSIEFTPEKAGTFEFTCGMSMLRGRLTVADGKEGQGHGNAS
jgi:plastocyanin domain-containing protein